MGIGFWGAILLNWYLRIGLMTMRRVFDSFLWLERNEM